MKIDKLCNSGYNIKLIYNILNELYLVGLQVKLQPLNKVKDTQMNF